MRKLKILLAFLLACGSATASSDSTVTLSFDEFMSMVREHHPVAQQAELRVDRGAANLMTARGSFDPKAFGDVAQKYLDGTTYYRRSVGGLKIPTWFGVEVETAFEQSQGAYVDPERVTQGAGLLSAGVSVPIGQGLFIDKRRAALRNAQVYQSITIAERQSMVNKLLREVGEAYWKWFAANHKREVYDQALVAAQDRFSAVKQSAALGDRPAIDTLEAGIQVQNRRLQLQQAELDLKNAAALLSVHIWAEGRIPLELDSAVSPIGLSDVEATALDQSFVLLLDSVTEAHPDLQKSSLVIDQLEIKRRMKREQLKPQLDLKYTPLTTVVAGEAVPSYDITNYRWGLNFSMPLLLRRERGELRMTELEIEGSKYALEMQKVEVMYSATVSLNEWETSAKQVDLYAQTVSDYDDLLQGERQMFQLGESSLFMVNSRELGYINARIKFIELLTINQLAQLNTNYAFGILGR